MTAIAQAIHNQYAWYKQTNFAKQFKRRRFERIMSLVDAAPGMSVLEVGCSTGTDFLKFAADGDYRCSGVDIKRWRDDYPFNFIQGNACDLPFENKQFDIAVSIGVFEHIQPIEDLCKAASEISRVAKRFCVVVPSIGTLFEPHTLAWLWAMRSPSGKPKADLPLNFLSDEAWLQLNGFSGATAQRFWYMPLIQNLAIFAQISADSTNAS